MSLFGWFRKQKELIDEIARLKKLVNMKIQSIPKNDGNQYIITILDCEPTLIETFKQYLENTNKKDIIITNKDLSIQEIKDAVNEKVVDAI